MAENKRVCLGWNFTRLVGDIAPSEGIQEMADGRWAVEYSRKVPKTSPKGNPKNTFGELVAGYMIFFCERTGKTILQQQMARTLNKFSSNLLSWFCLKHWWIAEMNLGGHYESCPVGTNAGFPEKSEWIYVSFLLVSEPSKPIPEVSCKISFHAAMPAIILSYQIKSK